MYHIVVDLEFTPTRPMNRNGVKLKKEVIEIGACKLDAELGIIDCFSVFIKPSGTISTAVSMLTGIYGKEVSGSKCFRDAMKLFIEWSEADTEDVVFYEWSKSDRRQLREEGEARALTELVSVVLDREWVDLQERFCAERQYSLSRALAEIGAIPCGSFHNAEDDALNTAYILQYLQNFEAYEGEQKVLRDKLFDRHKRSTIGELIALPRY